MTRKRVTVLDLAAKAPARSFFARIQNPNLASIMPQAIAAWCEELGHEVTYVCYTGFEDLDALLAHDADAVFISAFSRAAQTAYAIANLFRQRGAVTVIGGPHARCYPEDAAKYFDYVLGFTDKQIVDQVLRELAPRPGSGQWLSAAVQPAGLPSMAARWKFVAGTIAKAPFLKIVPMIGSMGCPYTCSFCIDSVVDYQPLAFDQLREDLRFLAARPGRPLVAWHDPNFGVRFDDYMGAIEDAVPPGRLRFIAESSLSLLSEPHLARLKRNGFFGMMPGIESWFDYGAKSKTGRSSGLEKLRQVSDHINMVLRYIPFVQTNFVLGIDADYGSEPFELTRRFVDMTPGAYPVFNLFTAYGRAAPLNLELQRADRVLPFPPFFLDGHQAMNVRPLNYEWIDFYRHVAETTQYAFTGARVWRRLAANSGLRNRASNYVRGSFSFKRLSLHTHILKLLESDPQMRPFFEGTSDKLPDFYIRRMRRAMGPLWDALPAGAVHYDHRAFHKNPEGYQVVAKRSRTAAARKPVAEHAA